MSAGRRDLLVSINQDLVNIVRRKIILYNLRDPLTLPLVEIEVLIVGDETNHISPVAQSRAVRSGTIGFVVDGAYSGVNNHFVYHLPCFFKCAHRKTADANVHQFGSDKITFCRVHQSVKIISGVGAD